MNPTTLAFIIGVIIIGSLFDLYQIVTKGYNATISATLWMAAKRYPIIPFVAGVVSGHLWWSQVC